MRHTTKIIIVLIICILITDASNGQTSWFWQNPLPQGNELKAVKFIDQNTGLAVGIKGTIIKSTDGGLNWVNLNSGTFIDLNNLVFISSDNIIAIGANSIILSSSNGGLNWSINHLNDNINLTGICFNNQSTGWISGFNNSIGHGMLYKTTNGGINWILNFTSPYDDYFIKIQFIDENSGWVGGGYTLFRTTSGGKNWNLVNSLAYAIDLTFKDTIEGMVTGGYSHGSSNYGIIRKTTNSGSNWLNSFSYQDTVLNSISFFNSYTGFVAGRKGGIFKSTNYGDSWFSLQSNTYHDLNSIYFYDSLNGWSVGKSGTIIKSEDVGLNWELKSKGIINLIGLGAFIDQNTGWISSAAGIMKSTDGGGQWSSVWDSISNWSYYPKFFFLNNSTGWLTYSAAKNDRFTVYKTIDGGINWIFQNIFIAENFFESYIINSINFIDNYTGFIVGTKRYYQWPFGYYYIGMLFKTTDGGLNWTTSQLPVGIPNDIKFINVNTSFIVGTGKILKTTNSGLNWISIPGIYGNFYNFLKISFINENTGWLSGDDRICKTTNGGLNWVDQSYLNISGLHSMVFLNEDFGWVCGNQGKIYATSNGGVNWFNQPTPTYENLFSITFINPNTGWAVGSNGTILKTSSGIQVGINQLEQNVPKNFFLSQNYPNPFNPKTKIKYSITSAQYISLKVYNILGKEITTLINERQNAGNYEVTFDGSDLSSGIYFYKLEAESFVETKRMMLLK